MAGSTSAGRRSILCSGVAAASIALTAPALAQTAAPAKSTGLEVIVVTAQKRAQSLQKVAASISALSSAQIRDRGIGGIADLAQSVPSLNYTNTSGSPRLTIRGVGLQVATGVAEANVAQHIDGIFQSQPTMATVAPVDLERIEVLRGPQGTLYGRNATGGTVNFITKKPTDTLHYGTDLGGGSFGGHREDGYVSGPLIHGLLDGRVSGYQAGDDGFYKNVVTGKTTDGDRRWGVRGALHYTPSDSFTADLSGYYQHDRTSGPVQTLLRGPNPLVSELAGFGFFPPGSVVIDTSPNHTAAPTDPYTTSTTLGATLDMSWQAADYLTIRSLSGYTRHHYGPSVFDSDGTTPSVVMIGSTSDPREQYANAFSQEVDFSGMALAERLKWLAGFYYFDGNLDASIPAHFPDPVIQAVLGSAAGPDALFTGLHQKLVENTKSYAGFADVTYSLTDHLRLNLGGRISRDQKITYQSISDDFVFGGFPVSVPSCEDERTRQKFNEQNGKARLEWDVAPDVLTYVQVQTGFKDGGVNLSVCGNTFRPEKLTSYEGGVKSSFLSNALTLNASVFHYNYKDLQFLNFTSPTNTEVDNIPNSDTTGGEIETLFRPIDNLVFNASVALLQTRINELSSFDSENPALGLQNIAGRDLPNSPTAAFSVGADYTIPTQIGQFLTRAELYHSSSYDFRIYNDSDDKQHPYTLVNLFLTYTTPDTHYSLRGFVKNAADTHYLNTLLYSSLTGIVGDYARPREWGIDLSVHF